MNVLNDKFLDTLKNDTQEVVIDIAETGLDSILENEVIRQIPIVKYLYIGKKVAFDLKEFFFIKKLTRFLNEISSISVDDRRIFLEKIKVDDEYLGEHILMIIEKLDSIEKPILIGRLFNALARGEIDTNLFYRLCNVVDSTYINDLYYLKDNIEKNELTGFAGMSLSNAGLAVRYTYDGGTWGGKNEVDDENQIGYRTTNLGKRLVEIVFKDWL